MNQKRAKVWARRVEEWKQSGLGQADFCKAGGFGLSSFCRWKARLERQPLKDPKSQLPASLGLVEIPWAGVEPKKVTRQSLTLRVNERYALELLPGFDEALLLKTLKVLDRL